MPVVVQGQANNPAFPLTPVELLLSGAAAGMIGRLATAPLDRVRILYQVNAERRFSVPAGLKTLTTIARNTGIAGLWRGSGAALLRVAPSSAISFATFDRYEHALHRVLPSEQRSFGTRFVAGALAGATAQLCTYPLELLNARNAAHWNATPRYAAYSDAFVTVVRTEGVGGLFRGLQPALLGMLPYAGLNFAVFETLKAAAAGPGRELHTAERLACGALAGLVAQTATYPIHVIKRRLQVSHEAVYASFSSGFLHVLRTEGVRHGLFKGVTITWLRGPFAVAVGFTTNDVLKAQFLAYKAPLDNVAAELPEPAGLSFSTELELSKTLQSLLAGATAGAAAKTVIAPGDRVKILYQVNRDRKFSWLNAYRTMATIAHETGVRGLWRGHGATLLRVVPYSALSYMSFERYEQAFQHYAGLPSTPGSRFACGAAAGATATALTYPLDLLRARHAAHWGVSRPDISYAAAIQRIVATEGFAALFNGLRPTLLGIVPYAGISFSLFHSLKAHIVQRRADLTHEREIDPLTRLALGGFSGLVAQSATYPLEIVRRRMQTFSPPYRSIAAAFTDILQREGWRALYKGLSLNWVKGPVSVAISFNVNDAIKAWFAEQERRRGTTPPRKRGDGPSFGGG